MDPSGGWEWEGLLGKLEEESRAAGKARAASLKAEVEKLIEKAEAEAQAGSVPPKVLDRLDGLLMTLTEAVRDACTNEKCPHYGKKCKMR